MKNIIWTEKELKAIKSIIITRSNHKLTEDLEFVKLNNCNAYTNTGRSLYEEVIEETQKLFFTTNEKEITRVLLEATSIEIKPYFDQQYSFLTNISRINPLHKEQIFTILKEIIAQYEKSISQVANKIITSCDNIEELKERTKEIYESTEETFEEHAVKLLVGKIFIHSNGVTDSELFTGLKEKLNSCIKAKLLSRLHTAINTQSKTKAKKDNALMNSYMEVTIKKRSKR